MNTQKFEGIIPALLTPYNDNDEVNLSAVSALTRRLVEQGVDGLFLCGTTGIWWLLEEEERMKIVETAIEAAEGKIRIMVHVGAQATRSAVRLAVHAEKAGADAISALPPAAFPYPPEAIWGHFRTIGASCGLPLYLYYIPQLHGDIITMDQFVDSLDTIPTLAGVKFSSYQVDRLVELKVKARGRLNILSGGAEQLLSTVSCGAEGSVCTWHNLIPRLTKQIFTAVCKGDLVKARELQDLLIRGIIDIRGKGHDLVHRMVTRRGIAVGHPRKPFPLITDEEFDAIYPAFKKNGLIEWCI